MKRKLLGVLLTMAMTMSLLVGCGGDTNESADGGSNAVVNQESGSSEQETEPQNTVEEQADGEDTAGENNSYELYTLSLCCNEELKQSAVVSYDPEKVKLIDLSRNAARFRWADRKSVELLLMCENKNPSVEDLYQKKMKPHEDNMSVSELTEKKIGDYTVLRGDATWKNDGTVGVEFFALKLENDMILYAVHLPGFEKQVYLDEMLPYVLAYVTTGDGTRMTPPAFDPNAEEDTSDGMEGDTFFEVTSLGGVKVKVYYDPDVIKSYRVFDMEFFLTDADGNEHTFAIADFATAEERRQGRERQLNSEKMLEEVSVSELQEIQAGEYTLKAYWADYMVHSYDGSGELIPGSTQEAIIELGSGVVCVFDSTFLFEHPEFGPFLNAMKFVIE
ncbi:MAG: hypothetical protein IJ335_05275 [Lachnospiraceae bacterium]|nr:hypothetical protein [Lachnospiraceae bacterium]